MTTSIISFMIDVDLTDEYVTWIGENLKGTEDSECQMFFRTLWVKVHQDWGDDPHVFSNVHLMKNSDGTWTWAIGIDCYGEAIALTMILQHRAISMPLNHQKTEYPGINEKEASSHPTSSLDDSTIPFTTEFFSSNRPPLTTKQSRLRPPRAQSLSPSWRAYSTTMMRTFDQSKTWNGRHLLFCFLSLKSSAYEKESSLVLRLDADDELN